MQLIKEQIKSGDVKGAAEALKKLLAAEPENVEAQMLYGTCCHLLGDDETFKKIHDELAPKMEGEKDERKVSLWRKYHKLWVTLIIGGLVLVSASAGAWYFVRSVQSEFRVAEHAVAIYAGPDYYTNRVDKTYIHTGDENVADL